MKLNKVSFAQLRQFLERFGFEFFRLRDRLVFEHKESDTLFVFRRYPAGDAVGEADLISVRHQFHYRGFMERDDFDEAIRTQTLEEVCKNLSARVSMKVPDGGAFVVSSKHESRSHSPPATARNLCSIAGID